MTLQEQQQVQEDLYSFPYHYIVQYERDFALAYVYDWGLDYASAVEFVLRKISEQPPVESIVDIGCGDGRMTRDLHRRFPQARLLGLDYSERAIGLARALNTDLGIDFSCVNILEDSLGECFDVATVMEVYEHIEPRLCRAFLQGIHRLLAGDGVLHMTVPHANIPVSRHHFRHFTVAGLTAELEEHFEILEVIPFERQSFRKRWLMRLLINRLFILNERRFRNFLYRYYKKHLFLVRRESECRRIYVKCRKK
jgi:SAM-dependent methyltransferase